jgi:hypothetical protein
MAVSNILPREYNHTRKHSGLGIAAMYLFLALLTPRQLRHDTQNNSAGVIAVRVIWRCCVTQAAHETGLSFLQVFCIIARRGSHILTSVALSSMSMLLAIQLYVAQILSSDPSHLENAASDAYVGSHVC